MFLASLTIIYFIIYQISQTIIHNDYLMNLLILDKKTIKISENNQVNVNSNYICIDYVRLQQMNNDVSKKDDVKENINNFFMFNNKEIDNISINFLDSYSIIGNKTLEFKEIKDELRQPFKLFCNFYRSKYNEIDNGILTYINIIFDKIDMIFMNLNVYYTYYIPFERLPIYIITKESKIINNLDNLECININRNFLIALYNYFTKYLLEYSK